MDEKPITVEPIKKARSRWFRLSPDRFVVGLLLTVCLLWLSDHFQWFGFNQHKGWTVLIAVAAVGVAAFAMMTWWVAGLIFRWRFQFGIRSLLAFCLVCSIAAGWLAVERERAKRQMELVEGIRNLHRSATYDWEVDADGVQTGNSGPPEPRWLRNTLGDNLFSTVVAINYNFFPSPENYTGCITDAGLEHLKGLTQLRDLDLSGNNITDAGLAHLKGLTQLRKLGLNGTKITDTGLEHVKGLTQLRELYLLDTKITDAGLEHLKGLTQLRVLCLHRTKITDVGLEHLKGLTQLRELGLYDTKITDTGLERFKGLTQLQELRLNGTNITDAGLEHIKGLTQLRVLGLTNTKVTDDGVEKLQQALPNCLVFH